jgi:type IV pilus assembly protein PilC
MIFIFTAKDISGVSRSGTVEAASKEFAIELLKNQNLVVVSITEKKTSILEKMLEFGGVSEVDVTNFTRQFATMINSGLPINKALLICHDQLENKNFKVILLEISKDIDSGTSLSGALSRYPGVFDTSYTSLVRAGESSGKLDVTLQRLADSYESIRDLKSRLKSAMIYPAIVLVVMFLVIVVLISYVIPQLTEIFTSINQELPWHTQLLVNLSSIFRNFWYLFLIIFVGLGLFLRYFYSTEAGKSLIMRILVRIPVFGKVLKQTELANYLRTLALLISSGIQITQALLISAKVSSNPELVKASIEASGYVEKGNSLSEYLRSNSFFDPIISSMVKIGEETGKIDELITKVADNYALESSYSIKGLSAALEPIILVILGISVGGIVLSVITPIYGLIGSFSQ